MTTTYLESFKKIKLAGLLASNTLDEITTFIKPGITTEKIDKICYEFIRDNGGYSAPLFYKGFPKVFWGYAVNLQDSIFKFISSSSY